MRGLIRLACCNKARAKPRAFFFSRGNSNNRDRHVFFCSAAVRLFRSRQYSPATIAETIDTLKKRDRYGEPILGFPGDRDLKPNEEILIGDELARKWEAAGLCVILGDDPTTEVA